MIRRSTVKFITIVLLMIVGLSLLFVKTDREYINLQPTEGVPHGVVLEAQHTYELTFIARRRTIARLGIFIRPAAPAIPDGQIQFTIRRGEQVLDAQKINTTAIDSAGATSLRFSPPLYTASGEVITLAIIVPPAVSGTVRLQTRQPDQTFDASNVSFSIDGQPQDAPLAYQVYHRYRPALAAQLGGLAILAALLIILPSLPLYVLGVSALFVAPSLLLGQLPLLLFASAAVSLAGMIALLRQHGASLMPALLGGHALAFNSWFILHNADGRGQYIIAAALPLLFLLGRQRAAWPAARKPYLWAALGLLVILAVTLPPWTPMTDLAADSAHPRDVFLDPNQTLAAQKVFSATGEPLSWGHFGSYLGPINVGLAIIGFLWQARRRQSIALIGIIAALAALTPLAGFARLLSPVPPQHLIIITTFMLAYFAAFGLAGLRKFLAPHPHGSDKVVSVVVALLALLALLDLWHVAAGTMEYELFP